LTRILILIVAAIALAACGEKPPRADPEGKRGYSNQAPQHPAHERTLNQGEPERIGN
jgi:predicted small lipoprotein YifL